MGISATAQNISTTTSIAKITKNHCIHLESVFSLCAWWYHSQLLGSFEYLLVTWRFHWYTTEWGSSYWLRSLWPFPSYYRHVNWHVLACSFSKYLWVPPVDQGGAKHFNVYPQKSSKWQILAFLLLRQWENWAIRQWVAKVK